MVPSTTEHPIERLNRQRRLFSEFKTETFSTYLERDKKSVSTDRLLVLNGWSDLYTQNAYMPKQLLHLLLPDQLRAVSRCGGYWIQLGGTGIAINPGRDFLERFHAAGFHVWDIDHVIITDQDPACSLDVHNLWSFNKEINLLLQEWNLSPHIITYWMHSKAYEDLVSHMRPHFREEINTVHRLETFELATETISLASNITLEYSPASDNKASPLMIKLCRTEEEQEVNSIGYLANSTWNERQTSFLNACQALILGIGQTSLDDEISSLGHLGVANILRSENPPQATVISEHDFSEGDTRIETLHYLYEEIGSTSTPLLPAESGTTLYLDSFQVHSPSLEFPTPIRAVKITRSKGVFSQLAFLDAQAVL